MGVCVSNAVGYGATGPSLPMRGASERGGSMGYEAEKTSARWAVAITLGGIAVYSLILFWIGFIVGAR